MNRFGSPYDAALHLLDRQVLDRHGLMVCKVDDLELTESSEGLHVTALLVGRPARLPRLSGPLGAQLVDFWERMGDEQRDRSQPYRIDLALVDRVDSAVHLVDTRRNVLVREAPDPQRHRMRDLLELKARRATGGQLGGVLDVRIDSRHRVAGLLVGPGRPGSLLGYDRDRDQGPAAVGSLVRWLHRHVRYVRWEQVAPVYWGGGQLTVTGELQIVRPVDADQSTS